MGDEPRKVLYSPQEWEDLNHYWKRKNNMTKIKLYVSTDLEIGPMTPTEMHGINKLRMFLNEHFMECSDEFCASVKGWHHSAAVMGESIRQWLKSTILTHADSNLPRMGYVIVPWVPEGELWPGANNEGTFFHSSWKIILRPFEKLKKEEKTMTMNMFSEWAVGAVGKPEQEVIDAVIDNGGEVCIRERDGVPVTPYVGDRPSTESARANLIVKNGIVTEITFA